MIAEHPAYLIETCPMAEAERLEASLPTILNEAETKLYEGLKTPKRRKEWLAGRIACKRALRRHIAENGQTLAVSDIEILNAESGKPFCRRPAFPLSFSISHTAAGGLCAVSRAGGPIGADWETIALRDRGLLRFVAHESEFSPELETSAAWQTRLWTLKEAILKLLGLGLALDMKDIRVLPREGQRPELHGRARAAWEELGAPVITLKSFEQNDTMIALAYA